MTRVQVQLGERSYSIDIGDGSLSSAGGVLTSLGAGHRCAVVTDANVGPLYAGVVTGSLEGAGFAVETVTVPAGERSKSVEQLARLWNAFVALDLDRDSTVVALGGGVVGDLAGFAAATYMRGIRCVQIPTTMLACVDSSVGGKTAIDLDAGKNLVGAFHQPAAVLIDPATLRTLPKRQLAAGLAEVIKYGVIMDAPFFERLERDIEALLALKSDVTVEAIGRCCELKARVTSADERESGLRAILNYGHTVGHALEAASGYEGLLHGEAVALGMLAAGRVAEALGMTGPDVTSRQEALLARAGLPTSLPMPHRDAGGVLDVMRHDKKSRGGKITMVLAVRIGEVKVVRDVKPELAAKALETLRGG
jgi:3-dehydroquinate synthase